MTIPFKGGGLVNVAVTVVFSLSSTMHGPLPVHPPPVQAENTLPFGVSVMEVPLSKAAKQALPQLIPDGLETIVPVPATTIERVGRSKMASTAMLVLIVNSQVDVLPANAQSPLHLLNTDVGDGVARIVSLDPAGYDGLQVVPLHVTVPVPVPDLVTANDTVAGTLLNVAVTARSVFKVCVQVELPEHPPPVHPENVDPAEAVAVSPTTVPPG